MTSTSRDLLVPLQGLEIAKRAARHAFESDLARRLVPPTKKEVKKRPATRRLYQDRLGKLPVELVHHIACYLPAVDVVSSWRVSKRWQSLLRSEDLCRILCLQNDFGNKQTTWESLLVKQTCRKQSLAYGRPWSATKWTMPLPDSVDLRNVTYYNGKLAYMYYEAKSAVLRSVHILHFALGQTATIPVPLLTPRITGPVNAMALSDSHFCCILQRFVRFDRLGMSEG
jgi:F-box domain